MKKILAIILSLVMLCAAGCAPAADTPADVPFTAPDMNAAYAQVAQAAKEMPAMMALDADMMYSFCGIAAEDVKQAVVYICEDSLRTDEIWLVEAVSEEAADRIVSLAQLRLKLKDEESITYSPEQNAVVKKAQLIREENCIALIVSPEVDAMAEAYRAAAGING